MELRLPLTCAALLIPLLAACDSGAPVADDEASRAASGEVLEGSISDNMLPLQDLRSQPPVAAPLPGETVAAPAGSPAVAEGGAETGTEPDDPAQEPESEPAEAE